MSKAIKSAAKKAAAPKAQVILELTTPMDVALKHLAAGEISQAQFVEWDAARVRLANNQANKVVQTISKGEFLEKAAPLSVNIGGTEIRAAVKQFATGSFGWFHSGKVEVTVGGKPVKVQVSLNLIVVGSKPST